MITTNKPSVTSGKNSFRSFSGNSNNAAPLKNTRGIMQKFLNSYSKYPGDTKSLTAPENYSPTKVNETQGITSEKIPESVSISAKKIYQSSSQNYSKWTKRPGYVSTEDKIHKELAEMKKREDELRQQRARSLGKSQPNLTFCGLNDKNTKLPSTRVLKSAFSNQNLADKGVEDTGMKVTPRKRNALAKQWQNRIDLELKRKKYN